MVGSAVGYLLAFPAWLTVLVVLAGTYLAIGGWAYILFHIHSGVMVLGASASAFIVGLLVLIVLAGWWFNRRGD